MNIFIAYKFTNIENKNQIQQDVHNIAKVLEGRGHKTFILGRDLQKWEDFEHPMHHKMRTIFNQIRKSDSIVAYVNSDKYSKGLMIEMILGTMLRKRIILVVRKGLEAKMCRRVAKVVIEFENFEQLTEGLKCIQN